MTSLHPKHREGLERARKFWTGDNSAYAAQQLRQINRMLRMVAGHQADLDRDPEFFAPLVAGFMGENGWAPFINGLVDEADREASRLAEQRGRAA